MKKLDQKKVLVGMSGGVDSSVAAAFLKNSGFEVTGIFFDMNELSDFEKARVAAERLEIPLIRKDLKAEFGKEVVRPFVKKWGENETPNPCVVCNPDFKFKNLLEIANKRGIFQVATGHYAQVLRTNLKNKKGEVLLRKGRDPQKDQSYFLYRLGQDELRRTIFPLGDFLKKDIKKKAQELDLGVFESESQGLCFLRKGESLNNFLKDNLAIHSGRILDEAGEVLGDHPGLEFFTLGQRFGLGLSGGPFFVLRKDLRSGDLIVTKNKNHPDFWLEEIEIKNVRWVASEPSLRKKYEIRTRYLGFPSMGKFERTDSGNWRVKLEKPHWATAAGQSLVAYWGDQVVGGGIIVEVGGKGK